MTRRRDDADTAVGLGSIDYSHSPRAVYYIDGAGERWRVHDCVFEDGKLRRVGLPGTPRATRRVFVNAAGVKRLYVRTPREIWEATEAHLARQLANAGYLPTELFLPEQTTPR